MSRHLGYVAVALFVIACSSSSEKEAETQDSDLSTGCQQHSDCPANSFCDSDFGDYIPMSFCRPKRPDGATCYGLNGNEECQSGWCDALANACTPKPVCLPLGYDCNTDADCCAGTFCDKDSFVYGPAGGYHVCASGGTKADGGTD